MNDTVPPATSGSAGRWSWFLINENDRQSYQIPDGFPQYGVIDWTEDDPILAYCDSWYEAESVARALNLADRGQRAWGA